MTLVASPIVIVLFLVFLLCLRDFDIVFVTLAASPIVIFLVLVFLLCLRG